MSTSPKTVRFVGMSRMVAIDVKKDTSTGSEPAKRSGLRDRILEVAKLNN